MKDHQWRDEHGYMEINPAITDTLARIEAKVDALLPSDATTTLRDVLQSPVGFPSLSDIVMVYADGLPEEYRSVYSDWAQRLRAALAAVEDAG